MGKMKALLEYMNSPCTQHFMLNGRCEATFGGYCPKKSQITNDYATKEETE